MKVNINNREITTPDSWNDLTLHQKHMIYGTLFSTPSGHLNPDADLPAKRLSIAMELAEVDDDFLQHWEQDCIQALGQEEGQSQFLAELHELATISDLLFDITDVETDDPQLPAKVYAVKLGLTINPYPLITSPDKKKKLYGPADGLENLTIYELGISFQYFEAYMREKNIEFAIELLAILWRPSKRKTQANKRRDYKGDRRLPYIDHETTVKRRIPLIKSIPTGAQQLMLFWFASCRQAIIDANPDIFKAPAEGEESGGSDYSTLLLEMAGGVVHLDAVSKQNYANVFLYLSKLERERKERVFNR